MISVKVVEAWEDRIPTPVPPEAKLRPHSGGGKSDPFFTAVYVDGFLLVSGQQADVDCPPPPVALAYQASDSVRVAMRRPSRYDAICQTRASMRSPDTA